MTNYRTVGLAAFAAMVMTAVFPVRQSAAEVTKTKDDCTSAWAVLAPADQQEKVLSVVKNHPHWKVGTYEPIVSQAFELVVFERVDDKGDVVVAHCGHGATCNEVATAVNKAYPNLSSPAVLCTREPPNFIRNGRSL